MTSTQTQLRGGTSSQCAAMTPVVRELVVDTTNKRLRLGDGSTAGGIVIPNFSDIQTQAFGYGVTGGTSTAFTLALAPALLAYSGGVSVEFKANANCGASPTLNVNGLGAVAMKKRVDGVLTDIEADDIVSGMIYRASHDGTYFQVTSVIDHSAASGAGWDLLAEATASASSSLDFTSGITSTYDNYALIFENILLSTNNAELYLRVRRSGQGSFDAGASDYGYIAKQMESTSTSITDSDLADDTATAILLLENVQTGSATGICGHIYAHALGQSTRALFDWSLTNHRHASGSEFERTQGAGSRDTATAIDGLRILPSSGTITSGKVYLFGIRSSI